MTTSNTKTLSQPILRALGFCGADDSVHPNLLVMISNSYPVVEFGILFRPDKEGQPRYATREWVERLATAVNNYNNKNKSNRMKLAAHLCGSRVNDVLNEEGDEFLEQLIRCGFQRAQINATAVNGVDTSKLSEAVPIFARMVEKFSALEFIIQRNDETRPLWEGLISHYASSTWPKNLSMLVDESKGTGVMANSWPAPDARYEIGYAGGIGPHNIQKVLQDLSQAAKERTIWIDMESSLRSIKNEKDVFDLEKCFQVIEAACELGIVTRPDYLT